ncbi:hypothetical protein [Candidatus Nitrosotenuis cloacae]|uniref:hypothetical protein n=1 Tax=Candidatus Nitrosotenuis cloacae TaxID=1603555 RepID=UPI0022818B4F|nr:hypothetical protein [Candidatus Nitrosotenuis cloacae]
MLEPISYEHCYTIDDVPLQWTQGFETFYPDLANFPICYVHFKTESERIYGFPVGVSFSNARRGKCSATITFLCNKKQSEPEGDVERKIKEQISDRFGVTNPLTITDLDTCTDNDIMKQFLKEVWNVASRLFGDSYPYGKLYDEMYSIVRFVAAWAPKTGRQSEMRALYNFQSMFGEKITVEGEWKFLDFFLIPTYREVQSKTLQDFPRFQEMFRALEKIWPRHWKRKGVYRIKCDKHGLAKYPKYTQEDADSAVAAKKTSKIHTGCTFTIESDIEICAADRGWGDNIDEFDKEYAKSWEADGTITANERKILNRLVSAFNRHPGRTTFFVWSLMSILHKPYQAFDKDYYGRFYKLAENPNIRGVAPKVVGCFLQQGFGHEEIIPVDTWVESFHKGPLGIDSKFDFFKEFKHLGKIERMIWKVSQAKKTNADPLMNVLWCIRFGETGNHVIRYANPLSCYVCDFHTRGCPGFEKIKNKKILIKEEANVNVEDITTRNGTDGRKIADQPTVDSFYRETCDFVCLTESGKPRKIFKENKGRIQLVDEFSASRITNTSTVPQDRVLTVSDLFDALGPNTPPSDADVEDS